MPPSSRRRFLMRVWFVLGAVLFLVRCVDQLPPYWKEKIGLPTQSRTKASDRPTQAPPHSRWRAPESERAREPAATTGPADTESLRIATWNLEWLDTAGRGQEDRAAYDYQELAAYAANLDADVIAVQEVASEEALKLVFSPKVYAFHLAARGRGQRTGFAYKKTLKVHPYPDLDALAQESLRAGADLGIVVGKGELRLLAVHLKAFCVKGPLDRRGSDCEKLRAQVPALEGWVDARASEQKPFVVLGDFNRVLGNPSDELYRELDDGDPVGLSLRRASMRTRSKCHGKKSAHAIDHIVLGGPATSWLAPDTFREIAYDAADEEAHVKLSDHCAIEVELHTPTR